MSRASENHEAAAQLSWSATSDIRNLAQSGESVTLNLRLHGLTSFKGAEVDLKWTPAGDAEAGCLAHAGQAFRASVGTTCTYLNRGTSLPVIETDDADRLHLAWANSVALASCTSGTALQITFDLSGCGVPPAATFQLCAVRLLDQFNGLQSVSPESLGTSATLSGGASDLPACQSGPALLSLADTSAVPGQTLVLSPLASGGNSLSMSLSAAERTSSGISATGTNLPPGATVDTSTAVFTWTPAANQSGSWNGITLTVTDPQGSSASTSFSVAVAGSNQWPVLTVLPDTTIGTFQRVVLHPAAFDAEGDSLKWSAEGLPESATLDSTTGEITWTSGGDSTGWMAILHIEQPGGGGCGGGVGVTVTVDQPPLGIFQAELAQADQGVLQPSGAKWVHRTVFPLSAGTTNQNFLDYVTSFIDPTVQGGQGLGMEVVLDVSTWWNASDPTLTAYWPPRGVGSEAEWNSDITYLAARYNINSPVGVRPSWLTRSVVYWHVEEELSFIPDTAAYLLELENTRTALRAGNPDCQTVLVGLTSDPTWGAAYMDLTTCQEPPGYDPTKITSFKTAAAILFSRPDIYDVIDFHAYAQTYAMRGISQWIKMFATSTNVSNAQRPIWCMEAGGPFLNGSESYGDFVYSEQTQSRFTYAMGAEALSNGVVRIAFEFYPPGTTNTDKSAQYRNVALVNRTQNALGNTITATPKPAYYAFQTLAKNLTRSVGTDMRLLLPPTATCAELDAIFHAVFLDQSTTAPSQQSVMWTGRSTTIPEVELTFDNPHTSLVNAWYWGSPVGVSQSPELSLMPGSDNKTWLQLRDDLAHGIQLPFFFSSTAPFSAAVIGSLDPTGVSRDGGVAPNAVALTWMRGQATIHWRVKVPGRELVLEAYDVRGRCVAMTLLGRDGAGVVDLAAARQWADLRRGVYVCALRDAHGILARTRFVLAR